MDKTNKITEAADEAQKVVLEKVRKDFDESGAELIAKLKAGEIDRSDFINHYLKIAVDAAIEEVTKRMQ